MHRSVLFGLSLLICFSSSPRAQMNIDATKITCDQFVHSKIGPPRTLAAWLSGFYHGKHDSRSIDVQQFEENLSKLERFCYEEKNFKVPVMDAVERMMGSRGR